jgi:ribulose-phosphate 3-epimerase
MAIICPTVTAFDTHEYRKQVETLVPFAKRIHFDLMDGDFAPSKSPDFEHIWLPHETINDVHLMYQKPMDYLDQLIKLKPHMVVIHNEAEVHHMLFAAELHKHDIKAGLAILKDTPIEWAEQIMHSFDHVLIFSGNLGYQGGSAVDFSLLDKVKYVQAHHPDAEIGWDGGVSTDNAKRLADAGVDVLNTGGFIMKADNPAKAYQQLTQLL